MAGVKGACEVVRIACFNEAERREAAVAIEIRLAGLGSVFDIAIDKYVWNLDQGMNHCGPHRLDVHFCGHVVRIYFTDAELAAYREMGETGMTDNRLHEILVRIHNTWR